MSGNSHCMERLGACDPAWGPLAHVIPSSDNRAFALITEPLDGAHRIVFGGRIIAESGPYDPLRFALSFDGTKLAVARAVIDGGKVSHRIEINGVPAYDVPLSTVHHVEWLSNDRLAWDGWNDDGDGRVDGGIRRFVNGKDVTDVLDFEPVIADRGRHAIHVKEGGVAYVIRHDGSRSAPVDVAPDADRWHWFDGLWSREERPARPEEEWDEARSRVRVHYRGVAGPGFHAIESGGGMRSFALNADGTRVAYVGIRYSGAATAMSRVVRGVIERAEGRGGIAARALQWPIALLFNPYFGVGHAFVESSRRYIPVDNGRAWKKGWRYAHDHFYTPDDELVVTCVDLSGARVVIAEEEGPAFDAVENVHHLADDDRVCYLARAGDDLLRVTA